MKAACEFVVGAALAAAATASLEPAWTAVALGAAGLLVHVRQGPSMRERLRLVTGPLVLLAVASGAWLAARAA